MNTSKQDLADTPRKIGGFFDEIYSFDASVGLFLEALELD